MAQNMVGIVVGYTLKYHVKVLVDHALKSYTLWVTRGTKGWGKAILTAVGQRVDLKVKVRGHGDKMRLKLEEVVGLRRS